MSDFAVAQRGVDTSGRPILATDLFWRVWQAILRRPRVQPFAARVVVVQGAFMSRLGGGADASAGYHDLGGCWDVRTWNLSDAEEQILWEEAELFGLHFWKRDLSPAHGGMDEHGHGLAVWDQPLAPGAQNQKVAAQNKRDGLASNGPDYMVRRTPLVLYPPERLMEEDEMANYGDQLTRIEQAQKKILDRIDHRADQDKARDQRQSENIRGLVSLLGSAVDQLGEIGQAVSDDATKQQVASLRKKILDALAANPDVDGPENPAATTTGGNA